MKEDTRQFLKKMEKELQQQEQKIAPAFEDPESLETGPEPEAYSNFANDYGKALSQFAHHGGDSPEKEEDGAITVLMLVASILSLSVVCVMLFWLQVWM